MKIFLAFHVRDSIPIIYRVNIFSDSTMSSSFAAELSAYYEAKVPYTALLKEAMNKQRPHVTHPRNENIRGRSDDRGWGNIQSKDNLTFQAASDAEYEAIMELQAAARKDAATKAKSAGKKKK